jgi:hypothetical protein
VQVFAAQLRSILTDSPQNVEYFHACFCADFNVRSHVQKQFIRLNQKKRQLKNFYLIELFRCESLAHFYTFLSFNSFIVPTGI